MMQDRRMLQARRGKLVLVNTFWLLVLIFLLHRWSKQDDFFHRLVARKFITCFELLLTQAIIIIFFDGASFFGGLWTYTF